MGLDGVELVMALEERFGVTLTDTEAEACSTPKAVIDLVFGKLKTSDERVCASQRAFYLLRKGVAQVLGVPRQGIVLDTDIRSCLAGHSEPQVWAALKLAVHARSWPALVRPTWLVASLWLLAVGTFLALRVPFPWLAAAACAVVVAFVAFQCTPYFCTCIPPRFSRIRNLVPFAVTSDSINWTRDQVAALVKQLVIAQLFLHEEQYREDADFVKDLGMG
jgi:acyl carrier protein